MRYVAAFLMLVVPAGLVSIAAGQNPSASSETQPTIALTIKTEHSSVKIGDPIPIEVTLTNKSDHDLNLVREIYGHDLLVNVRDADGKVPADTKYGYLWNGHVANPDVNLVSPQDLRVGGYPVTVQTGETIPWVPINVAKLYQMSEPGKYRIQVQKKDPADPQLNVKSNVITVTVNP